MKRIPWMLSLCTMLALALNVAAQEPTPPPPGELPPMEMPPPGAGPEMGPGGGPGEPPASAIERWMNMLKERNPEEFARMEKLRADNPEEFRKELKGRLREERFMSAFRDNPKFREFIKSLPENEREDILKKLSRGGPGHGPGGMHPMSPKIQKLEEQAGELAREYRDAADDARKQEIKGQLRANLETLFDARETERAEMIQRISKDLEKLKQTLTQRQSHRDEIIDKRLQELTSDNALTW